jgi:hypothetical protein
LKKEKNSKHTAGRETMGKRRTIYLFKQNCEIKSENVLS